jgi:hypothetical protein
MQTIQHMMDIRQDPSTAQASYMLDSSIDSSSSLQGMCLDPSNCALRAKQYRERQQSVLPAAIAQHEALLRHTPHAITLSEHAEQRLQERGFVWRDILSVVESCEPIEWFDMSQQLDCMRRMGHTRLLDKLRLGRYEIKIKGEDSKRHPLIVVCSYNGQPAAGQLWTLTINTAFDPAKVRPYQWSQDYTRRICFCPPTSGEARSQNIKEKMLLVGQTHLQSLSGYGADEDQVVYITES